MDYRDENDEFSSRERFGIYMSTHWRGAVLIVAPIVFLVVLLPTSSDHQWVAYTTLMVATFWITECLPLPITSLIPIFMFPMTGILSSREVMKPYMNDVILLFLGSIMFAAAVEQCGLYKRLAFNVITAAGYSHFKLLFATSFVTMGMSMWITNTAATTVAVPVVFSLLRTLENEGFLQIYETGPDGSEIASSLSVCYFCMTSYAATIGGVGSLIGSSTNMAMKGLYIMQNPALPDEITFPLLSTFGIPLMLFLYASTYFCMASLFLGLCRPQSDAAKNSFISDRSKAALQLVIEKKQKEQGSMTYYQYSVVTMFTVAIVMFYSRSPYFLKGWADRIRGRFEIYDTKFIGSSSVAMLVAFFMFMLPSTTACMKNCCVKYRNQLSKEPVKSMLDWKTTTLAVPFSYMFVLGAGFALSRAGTKSGLLNKIADVLKLLDVLPNGIIIFVIVTINVLVTNIASNVVTANLLVPIFIAMAKKVNVYPLTYCVAAGVSASFCFMLPYGTAGNMIAQRVAKIPTSHMVVAGIGPTICAILLTTFLTVYYAPHVWDLDANRTLYYEPIIGSNTNVTARF